MQTLLRLFRLQNCRYVPDLYRKQQSIGGHCVFSDCYACKATGFLICPSCKGKGRCLSCNGRGNEQTISDGFDSRGRLTKHLVFVDKQCSMCHGNGICPSCKGRKLRCHICNGTAKIIRVEVIPQGIKKEKEIIATRLAEIRDDITERFISGL